MAGHQPRQILEHFQTEQIKVGAVLLILAHTLFQLAQVLVDVSAKLNAVQARHSGTCLKGDFLEYADYLISLIATSESSTPSPAIKVMITKVLIDYYKNNKTLTQISNEINRSFNRTFSLKRTGLAITLRKLRTTRNPCCIDEYEKAIAKRLSENQYKYRIMSGELLFPNSPVGLLNLPTQLLSNLNKNNIDTVAQLMTSTGNEHLSGIREKSWAAIKAVQAEVTQRIQPEPLEGIEKFFRP